MQIILSQVHRWTLEERSLERKEMANPNDWRAGLKTNVEMCRYMLEHGIFSDCSFKVGLEEEEQTQIFQCHKSTLARNSPVFEAMFYGTFAEQVEEIRVPDIKPDIFKLMLIYIYTEEIALSSYDVARALAYAADKYMLTLLKEKCITYWCEHIDASNVLKVMLTDAPKLNIEKLNKTCWTVVQQFTRYVVQQNDFKLLPVSTLELILRQETLSCEEYELVMSAERWAEHQVKLRDLPEDSLRDCLEPLVPLMRFRAMSKLEFESGPGQSNWLTQAEKLFILQPGTEPVETINVTTSPRSAYVISSDVAMGESNFKELKVNGSPEFQINFCAKSNDIIIKGVRMFTQIRAAHMHGINQQRQYEEWTTISIKEDPDFGTNVAKGCIKKTVFYNSMMDVMFKTPAKLKKYCDYDLKIKCNNGGAYPVWSSSFSIESPHIEVSSKCTPVKFLIFA